MVLEKVILEAIVLKKQRDIDETTPIV